MVLTTKIRKKKAQELSYAINTKMKELGCETVNVCHAEVKGLIIIRIKDDSIVGTFLGGMTAEEILDALASSLNYVVVSQVKEAQQYGA